MEITIREAAEKDAPFIYEFVCDLEQTQFDKESFDKCYTECRAGNGNIYLVAERNDKLIGYISCHGQQLLHHLGLVYEIQELYVLPEHRNAGVGKLLVEKLEQWISGDNYKLLEVCSNRKRMDAHRFYLKNGFEHTSFKFGKQRVDRDE